MKESSFDASRFWMAFEEVRGQETVLTDWRVRLGPAYESASRYLRPTDQLSGYAPCPDISICESWREVVSHGAQDHRAVCRCGREQRPVVVQTGDLIVYEIDGKSLAADLASVFGFERSGVGVGTSPCELGSFQPYAGVTIDVVLIWSDDAQDMERQVESTRLPEAPSVVVLPTTRRLSRTAKRTLEARKHLVLDLSRHTEMGAGGVRAKDGLQSTLSQFVEANVPEFGATPGSFPTPAGATWGDVEIKFTDAHSIEARVRDVRRSYHYTELGMAGRGSHPSVRWDLLYAMAENSGFFGWSHSEAGPAQQKRKEDLVKDLQRIFRIENEDPIRNTNGGWQARFKLNR